MSENLRVAVVDDNPIMLQILVKTLQKYMHIRVSKEDIFTDGLSLLRALSIRKYDLILLDIEMPIMDGLQATMRIRNPENDGQDASVRSNLRHDASSTRPSSISSSKSRPSTPSPTIRQMRYALTSVGSGAPSRDDGEIHILQENRRVPIVAITANAFLDQQRRHCISVGMNDVVSKPITAAAIRDIISRYLDSDHGQVRVSLDALAELVEPSASIELGDEEIPSKMPASPENHTNHMPSFHRHHPPSQLPPLLSPEYSLATDRSSHSSIDTAMGPNCERTSDNQSGSPSLRARDSSPHEGDDQDVQSDMRPAPPRKGSASGDQHRTLGIRRASSINRHSLHK
ncbi:hypothetical protein DFS34DRAFT_66376 [Phlyctochytrium arcticum]|nr:hypothetical protein DFS34DRAFT_66376 [Phlyctochytrium arcticum]